MRVEITRRDLIKLIRGQKRIDSKRGRYVMLYAIIDGHLYFQTLLRIRRDGSLKLLEKPIKMKWFKYDKYMLEIRVRPPLFVR